MNRLKLVSLTTLTLAALLVVSAFSQSVAKSPEPIDPASLLLAHAGAHAPAQKLSPAQDAIAQGLAKTKPYKFESADYPGASSSIVHQENGGIAIGTAEFGGSVVAFTLKGRDYELFNLTGGQTFLPAGINAAGQIVGTYYDLNGVLHGFLDTAGVLSNIDVPGATSGTAPTGINDAGAIVGTYFDNNGLGHGFSTPDTGVSFTTIDFPSAFLTEASSVNNAGDVAGFWKDTSHVYHGFLWRNGTYESLDFPLASATIGLRDQRFWGNCRVFFRYEWHPWVRLRARHFLPGGCSRSCLYAPLWHREQWPGRRHVFRCKQRVARRTGTLKKTLGTALSEEGPLWAALAIGRGRPSTKSSHPRLRSLKEKPMNRTITLVVVLSGLLICALPSSAQQTNPDTATCSYTFSSGAGDTLLQYCVTANGNIPQLQSPAGQSLIGSGITVGEGYGICNELRQPLTTTSADGATAETGMPRRC